MEKTQNHAPAKKATKKETQRKSSRAARSSSSSRAKTKRGAKGKKSHFKLWAFGGLIALLVVAGALFAVEHVRVAHQRQAKEKNVKRGPTVETARVEKSPDQRVLTLEGEARPYFEATMYAKVSGYLKELRVLEGTVVKKGEILAVITSPETDQGYIAAVANYRNKGRIAARYKELLRQDLVSAQEAEQAFADADVAKANLATQQQLKDYEIVRAPFDGVVTQRFVDPGDLVSNASNGKSQQLAIVTVSDTRHLKVDAYVDQKFAPFVRAGIPVDIYLSERSDQRFPGEVSRASGALDSRTRMMFTEVDFDNSAGKIVPGSFVEFEIAIPQPGFFKLPVEALVTMKGQPAVAVVENNKLKFSPITILDNDGTDVTVSRGVQEGQVLALNVGSDLKDGDSVKAVTPPPGNKNPQQPAPTQVQASGQPSTTDPGHAAVSIPDEKRAQEPAR